MDKQEVLENAVRYFNGDDLAANVWLDKYCLKDKEEFIETDPGNTITRLAVELYRIELKYPNPTSFETIYNLLLGYKKFVLGGSPLFGIGNDTTLSTLGSCFVVDSPIDSYGGILKTDQELVQLMKRRGGVGFDISSLRPRRSHVENAASTSTGAVSFMSRFSNTTREVAQEGRRGALMLTMNINHPDIEEFITSKDDLSKITGANISVKITDEFMHCVELDEWFNLTFDISKIDSIKTIIIKVKAKDLWNKLIHQAWKNAEPGVLFWDRIIENSPADCYANYQTISTNPCQPGWATVLTPYGIKHFRDINIGDRIWSKEEWTFVTNKQEIGIKPVYKYETSTGAFYGTKEHKIISNGEKIEVDKAISIDSLRGCYSDLLINTLKIDNQDIMDGLVLGDGSKHHASNDLIHLYIGRDDQDYFDSEIKDYITKHRPVIKYNAYEIRTTITKDELPKTYERRIPIRYTTSPNKIVGFLRGLYSANGSVCGNRVTLKSASKKLIEDVQLMLNSIGIISYYTVNKTKKVIFKNGTYQCKESYDLNITRDKLKFIELIGFIQKYKANKLSFVKCDKPEILNYNIKNKEFISEEIVYNITVDNSSHTYWSGGQNVANCSELPLCAYDSCRLSAINIYEYIINPFTKSADIDVESLSRDVQIAQRMMDNIVDLEAEKILKIIDKIIHDPEDINIKKVELDLWNKIHRKLITGRRTGLGQMGLADAGAAMGLKYGSQDFNQFGEFISQTIAINSYISSIQMAEERGCFSDWDIKKEQHNLYIQRILSQLDTKYGGKYFKYGRRNIANLTIAPTGSISILSQCSSGIEPVFALSYKRKRKVTEDHPNKSFQDKQGDWWEEYDVFHSKYQECLNIMPIVIQGEPLRTPYWNATAHDIDPFTKIELQAKIQPWIDHSISVTYNLPSDTTEETVSNLYFEAWKKGLKGMTVYREGSREGVLKTHENAFKQHDAPKRPKILPHEVYSIVSKGHHWMISVGILENKPYEVFAFNNVEITGTKFTGEMTKLAKGRYDLFIPSENRTFLNITNDCSDEENLLTRMISTSLRHGADIKFVVEQLNKSEGDITSFGRGIARILKKYIPDGIKSNSVCPDCGSILIYEGGCSVCKECGQSKCG